MVRSVFQFDKKCHPNSCKRPRRLMIFRRPVTWMSLKSTPTSELGPRCPIVAQTVSKKQAVCAQTNGDNSFRAANIKGTLSKYRPSALGLWTAKQPQLARNGTGLAACHRRLWKNCRAWAWQWVNDAAWRDARWCVNFASGDEGLPRCGCSRALSAPTVSLPRRSRAVQVRLKKLFR